MRERELGEKVKRESEQNEGERERERELGTFKAENDRFEPAWKSTVMPLYCLFKNVHLYGTLYGPHGIPY